MNAMRLFDQRPAEQNPLALVELPVPEPAAGQLLLQVSACGVCHTDLHIVEGDLHPPRLPLTPGHQVVGRVVGIGETAFEQTKLQLGQRVGVPWLAWACGACEFCRRGEENLCPQARFTGFHAHGGFADFMLVEERYALPLPDEISDLQAAPLLCAGIIGYRSLRLADLQPGERLGLVGFGASAHLAIQLARHWGCTVDVFTRSAEHRRHALSLGAEWAGGIQDEPPAALDRAVLFAPSGALVPLALEKLRPGGTLAINAVHLSPIPELPYPLIYGERTLRSVANATYRDGLELLELARQANLHADVVSYELRQANQALQDLKYSRFNGEAVLFFA